MAELWDWTPGDETRKPARKAKAERIPMTPFAEEVAARVKETFYHYVNRKTADNRNAQATLGPSGIGYGCDRRLAMSLLRIPPVNPPRYDWSSFLGTCAHAGIADMFEWANQGSGRYATEVPLVYPSSHVPHGTTDLIDRVLFLSVDQKVLGNWSLEKFRTVGPPAHYRIQVQTYGYGARAKGEQITKVAIIVWPREKSSLDDLYVWEEDYDPSVGRDALTRVDEMAHQIAKVSPGWTPAQVAKSFDIDNSDCKFCPFHMAGATNLEAGCNGRV